MNNQIEEIKNRIGLNKVKKSYQEYYDGSKEAWSQNIDYFNGVNNLLVAFLLAVFSTLFIQTALYILEKSLAENTFYFSVFGTMIFAFFISTYLLIILILSRYQVDKLMKRHESMMKSSKKIVKSI